MSTTYAKVSTKDMKHALEQHFGWRGFSVRQGRNSRYITIQWTNGPSADQVRKVTAAWNDSKQDDSMTDLWIGCQYTSERRDFNPDGARRVLAGFDLRPGRYSTPNGLPPLWELLQNCGRELCAGNGAKGWAAGEDWLELVEPREWFVNEWLPCFRSLGYRFVVGPHGNTVCYWFTPKDIDSADGPSE